MTSCRPALLARWLRCSAGGAGSAGYAGRPSHSRAAGAALLAWGLRQSGGGHRMPRTGTVLFYPHGRQCGSPVPTGTIHFTTLNAWRQSLVVPRPPLTIGRPASRGSAPLPQRAGPHGWQTRAAQAARVFTGGWRDVMEPESISIATTASGAGVAFLPEERDFKYKDQLEK